MRTRSPQRSRKIRTFALVGAVVGFFLGLVLHAINGHWYGAVVFALLGAGIAAATAALSADDYDLE
ncbi:MAG: hypothetical protein J5707_02490 [Candidatus Methanomethylophilus sp.]|nr:hypothetical protein [Methanomethylophilus sp.]